MQVRGEGQGRWFTSRPEALMVWRISVKNRDVSASGTSVSGRMSGRVARRRSLLGRSPLTWCWSAATLGLMIPSVSWHALLILRLSLRLLVKLHSQAHGVRLGRSAARASCPISRPSSEIDHHPRPISSSQLVIVLTHRSSRLAPPRYPHSTTNQMPPLPRTFVIGAHRAGARSSSPSSRPTSTSSASPPHPPSSPSPSPPPSSPPPSARSTRPSRSSPSAAPSTLPRRPPPRRCGRSIAGRSRPSRRSMERRRGV